jgi:phosphatidylserine/phosphatidylglycerophosphate/cardiolipin synthase-like enzyme
VSVLSEPQAGSAPFLKLIDGARTSIELTIYELFDRQVERALAGAARRGVDVRVLLTGGYYSRRETTNATAYRYLAGRGAHVRYSPTYLSTGSLQHNRELGITLRTRGLVSQLAADFSADYRGARASAASR